MPNANSSTNRVCVIIPTFNNQKTLSEVISDVLKHNLPVYVVNDGSTDSTPEIIQYFENQITPIHISKNQGKGNAILTGFSKAREDEFTHAITIDSDGQHFAEDIPRFLEELDRSDPATLLIGSRDMTQNGIPGKSSFGNKFSNFWFQFETGIKLSDTQSGFRLYPLNHIPRKLYTNKFEFEIEIIVRSAWKGVDVRNIPIKIYYDPIGRVSHFRPFKDFTRISILNTVLVTIAIFYIKPRDFFRNFKKKSVRKFLSEDVLSTGDSNEVKALSLSLGIFIGIIPVWGFQTFLSIFFAVFLKLNKAICFLGSNVSIPPMIPIIVIASIYIGNLFFPASSEISFDKLEFSFQGIKMHILQYMVGSFVLAIFASIIIGLLYYLILKSYTRKI